MRFVCLRDFPALSMLELVKRFGDNLRRARERAGLTQVQLAERMGLKRNSAIAVWEGRDRPPRPRTVTNLAIALGCPASVLMDDVSLGYDLDDDSEGESSEDTALKKRALSGSSE
jgi:transcriptional regulator with XRE-family HTH domain